MKSFLAVGAGICLFLAAGALSAQASGPYQFYGVTPCRIVDTRMPTGPTGGPSLNTTASRDFPIIGYCNIPSTAKAATFNVTMVQPSTNGFIKIWPAVTPPPAVSNINATAGTPAIANAVVVLLTSGTNNITGQFGAQFYGTCDIIIDVTGYFQ